MSFKFKVGGGIKKTETRQSEIGCMSLSLSQEDGNKTIRELAKNINKVLKLKRGEFELYRIIFSRFTP